MPRAACCRRGRGWCGVGLLLKVTRQLIERLVVVRLGDVRVGATHFDPRVAIDERIDAKERHALLAARADRQILVDKRRQGRIVERAVTP